MTALPVVRGPLTSGVRWRRRRLLLKGRDRARRTMSRRLWRVQNRRNGRRKRTLRRRARRRRRVLGGVSRRWRSALSRRWVRTSFHYISEIALTEEVA